MNNNNDPQWTSLLSPHCKNENNIAPLKAAIFTTYEAPDTAFLVEDFLPKFLGLNRTLTDESDECFWAELKDKLDRSNIAIISSFGKEISEDYKWLWRYVDYLTTGSNSKAVQHAKLWLIHRQNDENDKNESLEIHVSSSNLTKSAFIDQIQSAWRIIVPLSNKNTKTNMESWGVLPDFLGELGKSCDNKKLTDYFCELLKRAKAPSNVNFLASVPGTYRSKPWGSHGLSKLKLKGRGSIKIRVFVPYVGNWTQEELEYWTNKVSSTSDNLTLIWIDKNQLKKDKWIMPKTTFENLMKSGSKISNLSTHESNEDGRRFHIHEDQTKGDERWSHSKIYKIQRGNNQRIIITSANFSQSAWGKRIKNGLRIDNFEFGVAISKRSDLSRIKFIFSEELDELEQDEAYLVDYISELPEDGLAWSKAEWNGKEIRIKCRTVPHNEHPDENVTICADNNKCNKEEKWKKIDNFWEWTTDWDHKEKIEKNGIPHYVFIEYNSKKSRILLNDLRDDDEKELDPIPEVDPERSQELKDTILLERYSRIVDDTEDEEDNGSVWIESQTQSKNGTSIESDYSLPWLVQAREWFIRIDNWAKKHEHSSNEIGRDGIKLIKYFQRKKEEEKDLGKSVAAMLAAQEIEMRIGKGG